jgi:hypothetical protein
MQMKYSEVKDDEIMHYLLGGLSETEQMALEEAFVSDPNIFTLVAEIENNLIDDYVRGQLAPLERELFERNFLTSPGRRRRLEIAKSLLPGLDRIEVSSANHTATVENPVRRRRFFSFSFKPQLALNLAMASAGLLIATGGAWLLHENWRLRQELRIAQENAARQAHELARQIEDGRQQNGRLANEIAQLRSRPASQITPSPSMTAPGFVTLLLASELRAPGAGDIPQLTLPPNAGQVRLVLKMEDSGYPSYRAEIQSATGMGILTVDNLKPTLRRSVATFTVFVPSDKFTAGVYTLTLNGVGKNGEADILSKSSFRMEKR